jgi:tripartite-type tricarboxylate transporter receptor subunit TctC
MRKWDMCTWKMAFSSVALLMLGSIQALAQQSYPSRNITMVVPFAAGGPTDIVGRIVAEHMSRTLGQQIVIENVAGAAGTTGAARVAKADADGYTIMVGPMSTMSFTPALYPRLAFNPLTDFEPIGIAASAPIMLVINNAIPATKLSEFADYMKANAGKLTNGNAGVGSTSHLACLLLNNRVGASATMVPYRGTGPALIDVVSGQVGYLCDQVTSLMSQVKASAVKPLAVLAPTRSPVLPDVPTASEAGMSGIDMVVWNALFAPKGTPPEIIEKLNAALIKAISDPVSREKFLQLGAEPPADGQRSPQALRQVHSADVAKWGEVIRAANITIE